MQLTVCVCVRDGEAYADRCLGALLADTAPFATPIVVVDHASRDRTPALLARWAAEYPDRLRVVRFDGDGLGAVRDFAWRQAESEWVAFVDVDCEVQPGWAQAVADAIRLHDADPRCGAFGGTNSVADRGRLLYRACAVLLATYVGGHDSILNRKITERRRIGHCPTLNVVYRRRALARIDGFDPAYTRVSEDVDVSRRLLRAGYELWANPGMVVDHEPRPTLGGWVRNVFLYGRGRAFFLKRHPEEVQLKFFAPAAVVAAYAGALVWGARRGAPLSWLALLALAHFGGIALLLIGETRRQGGGPLVWLAATTVAWLTHLAYGAGLLYELPFRRDRFVR